jgi:lipoprotein-releasing system permease protein
MMGFERFIARRYLLSRRKTRFISIISLISVIGITVGVAALIIVLSVFNGFNSLVTDILVGFDPHLRIEPAAGAVLEDYERVAAAVEGDERIASYSPVAGGRAMIVVQNINRIITVYGESNRIGSLRYPVSMSQ